MEIKGRINPYAPVRDYADCQKLIWLASQTDTIDKMMIYERNRDGDYGQKVVLYEDAQ